MFSTIDVLVNNGRIFYAKPCTDFTTDDFDALASVNLLGFLYITQMAVKQMVKRKSGSAVTVTGTRADNPIAGVNTSVSMIKNSTPLLPVPSTRPYTRMIARILLRPCSPWERAAQHRIWSTRPLPGRSR